MTVQLNMKWVSDNILISDLHLKVPPSKKIPLFFTLAKKPTVETSNSNALLFVFSCLTITEHGFQALDEYV